MTARQDAINAVRSLMLDADDLTVVIDVLTEDRDSMGAYSSMIEDPPFR